MPTDLETATAKKEARRKEQARLPVFFILAFLIISLANVMMVFESAAYETAMTLIGKFE